MKHTKYILIVIALYFGIEYHNKNLKITKEIQSIEDGYRNELDRKSKEYNLNSENITFQRDSTELMLDQKYLILVHEIEILYLQEKFDDKTYRAKLQELKNSESKEASDNIKSWITKNESNPWPRMPIPDLMYEKRNSSQSNSKALFVISGLLLLLFPLIDISKWRKCRSQDKDPSKHSEEKLHTGQDAQGNKLIILRETPGGMAYVCDPKGQKKWILDIEIKKRRLQSLDKVTTRQMEEFDQTHQIQGKLLQNQMIRDGKTLTRVDVGEGDGYVHASEIWEDENGNGVEVPNEEVAAWEMANELMIKNQMVFDGQTLTRQKLQLEDGSIIDEWIGEDGMDVDVPEEITATWDRHKQGNLIVTLNVNTSA